MSAGKFFNFLAPASSGGTGTSSIPQNIVNIIEANTGTQTDALIVEVDVTYANGVPTQVLKYGDAGKTLLLYTINVTWANGVPTSVVSINHDEGITKTTTLTWYNGSLSNVSNTIL